MTSASVTSTFERHIVELASLRRRLLCLFYDAMLVIAISMGAMIVLTLAGFAAGAVPHGLVGWGFIIGLLGLYCVGLWHKQGQTLAMVTWRLQIVDARTGLLPSKRQCLIRFACALPSIALMCTGIGLIWTALVDRERQFPHDRMAGTCIVFNPRRPAA